MNEWTVSDTDIMQISIFAAISIMPIDLLEFILKISQISEAAFVTLDYYNSKRQNQFFLIVFIVKPEVLRPAPCHHVFSFAPGRFFLLPQLCCDGGQPLGDPVHF